MPSKNGKTMNAKLRHDPGDPPPRPRRGPRPAGLGLAGRGPPCPHPSFLRRDPDPADRPAPPLRGGPPARHDLRRLHRPRHDGRLRPDRLDPRGARAGRRGQDPRPPERRPHRPCQRLHPGPAPVPRDRGDRQRRARYRDPDGLPPGRGPSLRLQSPLLARARRDAGPAGRHRHRPALPGPGVQHGPDRPHQRPGAPAGPGARQGRHRPGPTATSARSGGPSPWPAAIRSESSSGISPPGAPTSARPTLRSPASRRRPLFASGPSSTKPAGSTPRIP